MPKDLNIPGKNSKDQYSQSEVDKNSLAAGQAGSQEQPTGQPLTPNPEPSTSNMEVHHHPNLHHRKKHWKEYFFEGLMIFLAVTLGFFAESYRGIWQIEKRKRNYYSITK